jgi:hypothetical protein
VDTHGSGQECALNDIGRPALAIIAELCSAIETHPLGQTNDFVENARKRARDFLEASGMSEAPPIGLPIQTDCACGRWNCERCLWTNGRPREVTQALPPVGSGKRNNRARIR